MPPFTLFGSAHLATLAIIVALAVALPLLARRGGAAWRRAIAYSLALLLAAQELASLVYRVVGYGLPLELSLPIQLCDLAVFLAIWVLLTADRRGFQPLYFWGLAGTLQAAVTPDLPVGFPHPGYVLFFLGHGVTLVAVFFCAFAYDLRPTLRGALATLLATNLWAFLVAAPVNAILGTNYLFLCAKPAQATLIDHLGPWPWYLLALEGVALASFLAYWAPWAIAGRLGRSPAVRRD